MLMQFPLLQEEALLWPTLFRLFWSEGIETVSTFTFFRRDHVSVHGDRNGPTEILSEGLASRDEEMLFHLLVSSCDHVFVAERPLVSSSRPGRGPDIKVRIVTSPTHQRGAIQEVGWDPGSMLFTSLEYRL